ncbi:sigma-70 family RNA polymerase sigma factor [Clostridiaceae bacterium UIB06]|uniref:Sigma-70 family RNA polymerase sigma factor n=1 Tax=Clostridium thailandense TaxID=2794346 RepID=A0A949WPP7_9CLOT|nr:sigma-70 family RNA polymerase sigma factor [Clostridium thailandense]MBV7271626.1 sigma-70 family RNA polymerase sigma factor [Clostridium thailandense]MCH5136404.1 sigma-70 family RNA polymerase sigma factor [Clostridiaceae bacterium UIB06]
MVFIIEELIKRAKGGDSSAVDEIIQKFSCFVIKQAAKYRIPSYEFDDLVQHGYLSIIRAIHLYKMGNCSFTTYCNSAVINNFKALLKGEIKHLREIQDDSIIDLKEHDFTLEDEVIAYDEAQKVRKALDKLQGIEKDIIEAVYIKGKTLKEAAADFNIKYRIAIEIKKEALNELRKYLK